MNTVVVGLGTFGLAISRRLDGRGQPVLGVDTDAQRREFFSEATGRSAFADVREIDPSQIARILVVVRTETQVRHVLQTLAAWRDGPACAAYVMATVSPTFAREMPAMARADGAVIEMPLTGGEPAARAGTLVAMAAGTLPQGEKDVLHSFAERIVEFARPGEPALAKLLNNLTIAYQAATLAEILKMGSDRGLPAASLLEVIANGAATSFISRALLTYNDGLLAKDIELLRTAIPEFPQVRIADIQEQFAAARRLLS
ncbi:MAG TPA: NAD(P)-binding domain-containing protein [Ramlibacter sp.]|uniref:NAD(P)-binding domain-containing protein n=1 Tax=Ramlibacter sp. TaxID=1917967 RepID=UPI002BE976E3|nr:NAD(P)-binding domain-containing protein [Ramlibacter sp.]HVZ46509.1 NAD(P)-binding domain-containing protein [Ramlibacter sp.]